MRSFSHILWEKTLVYLNFNKFVCHGEPKQQYKGIQLIFGIKDL